jgi:hypothetical protein
VSDDHYRHAWSAGTSCRPQTLLRKPRERCTYCRRYTFKGPKVSSRQRTRDHLIPLSKGGKKPEWVIACNKCNQLRSNLSLDDWLAFIARYPKWWLDFKTHKDVLKAIARYSLLEAASDSRLKPLVETGTGSIGEADESGGARRAIAQGQVP